MLDYVSRCGLDRTRSWAGAHVLVKLLPVSCRTSVTIPLQIGEEVIGRIAVDWVKREKSNRKGALAGLDSASNVSRKFHS